MGQSAYICLQCGRTFIMALPEGADVNDQECPVCHGKNMVKHEVDAGFFNMLFGGGG